MAVNIFEFEGEFNPSYQPTIISEKQRYNLRNQSWGIPRRNKLNVLSDPLQQYEQDLHKYPSNSEVVWTGLQFQPVESGNDPYERLFTNLYTDKLGSETLAAKGYFFIDVLRRGQSRQEAYSSNNTRFPELLSPALTLNADLTEGGAKLVEQFAGRVFYAGFSGKVVDGDIRSPNLSNYILFTQLIKNKKDFVKCYQEGDPTARDNSDVVDTDGGFIKLAGAENIIGMISLGSSLVVIATNGVWAVMGGGDYGFGATNYKVDKISSFGGIAPYSIIQDGSRVFFWAEDGIYVVAKDQFGSLTVTSITETAIQTIYQSISNTAKRDVFGTYDSLNKTIRWIYKVGSDRFTSTSVTYELVLNTVLGAFSRNRVYNPAGNTAEIFSSFSATQFSSLELEETVLVETDVVESNGLSVTIPDTFTADALQSTRYLAFVNNSGVLSFTFAFYRDSLFRDWADLTPVDAKAYLLTGALTGEDSSIPKQVPYLTMHLRRTETGVTEEGTPDNQSGCLVRSQWDFSNTINSKKWSPLFQAYRYRKPLLITGPSDIYDNGFELVTTKNKLRGRGRAFSLYMETEPLKDCRIVGWNISVNANQNT
jgi:hypothetical protein